MENPLWEFSVQVYSLSEVAAACLSLQDEFGVDVNLVLAAAYLGGRGHELSAIDARTLAELVRDWQEQVITPVRKARRAMKQIAAKSIPEAQIDVASMRDRAKSIELDAERFEQNLIYSWLHENKSRNPGSGEAVIRANVVQVLRLFNAEESADRLGPLFAASMFARAWVKSGAP